MIAGLRSVGAPAPALDRTVTEARAVRGAHRLVATHRRAKAWTWPRSAANCGQRESSSSSCCSSSTRRCPGGESSTRWGPVVLAGVPAPPLRCRVTVAASGGLLVVCGLGGPGPGSRGRAEWLGLGSQPAVDVFRAEVAELPGAERRDDVVLAQDGAGPDCAQVTVRQAVRKPVVHGIGDGVARGRDRQTVFQRAVAVLGGAPPPTRSMSSTVSSVTRYMMSATCP